jgi:nitroreductase
MAILVKNLTRSAVTPKTNTEAIGFTRDTTITIENNGEVLVKPIDLGYQGDNHATTLVFDISKLKEMLAYVPTGCNFKGLHFSFIEDVEVMNQFRNHVNEKVLNALTKKPIKAVAERFAMFKKFLLDGDDVLFRGAPHMVVVSNSIKAPCAKEDPIIALSYFELYAQSLGLGTCWCGLVHGALMLFPELSEYLEIPEGYKPSYVMLFGPKNVNYSRTTQPNLASISVVEKKEFEKLSAKETIKRYFWNIIR